MQGFPQNTSNDMKKNAFKSSFIVNVEADLRGWCLNHLQLESRAWDLEHTQWKEFLEGLNQSSISIWLSLLCAFGWYAKSSHPGWSTQASQSNSFPLAIDSLRNQTMPWSWPLRSEGWKSRELLGKIFPISSRKYRKSVSLLSWTIVVHEVTPVGMALRMAEWVNRKDSSWATESVILGNWVLCKLICFLLS